MSNVTKTLTLRYATEGSDRAKQVAEELKRTQEAVQRAAAGTAQAIDASTLQINSWTTSYRNFTDRVDGTQKALRTFFTDLKALNAGMRANAGDVETYAAQLEKIQQQLTNMGKPSGQEFGMAADISKRLGIGRAASDAEAAARVIDREFTKIEQAARDAGMAMERDFLQSFGRIGQAASEMGATTSALRELNERLDLIADNRALQFGQGINERLGVGRQAASEIGATTSALRELAQQLEMVDQARSARFGQSFNESIGIGRSARDAGASFSALDQRAQQQERASRIIAEIDPITAARARLNDEIRTYNELNAAGLLTNQQLTQGIQVAETRFDQFAKAQAGVGDATRLGTQDLQNMQYQLNDIAVSLVSGQAPFTVLMQQGAQMAQVFGPGATVQGALKSVGESIVEFISNPLTLAVLGFAAAAGAADLLYTAFMSGAPSMEKSLEKQNDLINKMTDRYKGLGEAIEGVQLLRTSGFEIQGGAIERDTAKLIKDEADRLMVLYQSVTTYRDTILRQTQGAIGEETADGLGQLNTLMGGFSEALGKGERPVEDLRRSLVKLYGEAMAEGDVQTQKAIELAFQQTDALSALKNMADETAKALREAQPEQVAARENAKLYAEAMNDLGAGGGLPVGEIAQIRADFEKAFAAAQNMGEEMAASEMYARRMADALRESREAMEGAENALANLGLDPDKRRLAEIEQEFDQRKRAMVEAQADEIELNNLERERIATREAARIEIDRENAARRENFALDMQEIEARSVADKAALAAERERVRLREQGYTDPSVIEGRAAEAATLARAQAEYELAEATRQRGVAEQQTLDQLRMEIDAIGQSAGEVARLSEEYRLLADAKERAYQEGRVVTPEEIADIQRQAAAVGQLNQELAEKRLLDDVMSERAGFGMTDDEREIFDTLRSAGIDISSANGQWLASQIRVNQEMERTRDIAKDTFKGFLDDLRNGESLLGSLGNALANFSTKMADRGMDMLLDQMMGLGGASNTVSAPAGGGGLGNLLQQVASYGSGRGGAAGTAPVGAVTRAPLPPLVTGEGFNQGRAAQVAAQSVPAQVWNFFANKGLASHQIAGILGNAKAESGFNFSNSSGDGGNAWGLFQWNDRRHAMTNFVGSDWKSDLNGQLEFAWHELQTSESKAYRALLQATDVVSATEAFLGFERPSGYPSGVRNSHNYSGRVAFAQEAYRQFGGGGGDASVLAQAVSAGQIDAAQKIATGGVAGLDPWGGMRTADPWAGARAPTISGAPAAAGGAQQGGFLQSPLFAGAMTALGAGMAGYQSGSPIGGALSGALAGFASGGPVGALVGGISGLIGGLFGSSKQKKQEEEARKQKEAQQAQMAAQLKSQIEDLSAYFSRSPDDNMATELRKVDQKIAQLRASIKNDGIKSEDQVDQIEREAVAYKEMLVSEFRDVFDKMAIDVGGGLGLNGEFNKARQSIRELGKQYRGFVEDTEQAYRVPTELRDAIMDDYKKAQSAASKGYNSALSYEGRVRRGSSDDYSLDDRENARKRLIEEEKKRDKALAEAVAQRDKELAEYEAKVADLQAKYEAAVAKAREMAIQGLLAVVSGDVIEQSDVEKALDESSGAASALTYELMQLGLSAEDAGNRIEQALAARLDNLRETFTEGLESGLNDLNEKGYINEVRDFLKEIENLRKDADLLGTGGDLVEEYFVKQSQAIVDGAQLSGDALAELTKIFPELTGKVIQFGASAKAITDRVKSFNDRLQDATTDTSTLSGATAIFNRGANREREEERKLGGGAMLALEAALAAERVEMIEGLLRQAHEKQRAELESTISSLESFSKSIADLRKSLLLDDELSPLSQQERLMEAQRQFRDVAAKAAAGDEDAQRELAGISQEYLNEAKDFYASSEGYYAAFKEVDEVLKNAQTLADQQLATQKAQLEALEKQLEATDGVKDSIESLQEALTKALNDLAIAMKANTQLSPIASGGGQTVIGTGAGAITTGNTSTGSSTSIPAGGINGISRQDLETWGFIGTQFQAILGRGVEDRATLDYYTNLRNQGATADDLINMIKNSPEAKARGWQLGGYTGSGAMDEIAGFVHRNELVWSAADIARAGGLQQAEMIRTAPQPAVPSAGSMPTLMRGDDPAQGGWTRIERQVDRLIEVVFQDGVETRGVLQQGNVINNKAAQAASIAVL